MHAFAEKPLVSGDCITVTSDLQAAIASWVTPKPAKMATDNMATGGRLIGGALIVVGIHYHLRTDAASEGFTINQVFNGVTTPLWSVQCQAADTVTLSVPMWRPLSGPLSGSIHGGRISLALIGTPAAGSWVQLDLLHHHDTTYSGRWTATGAAVIYT